MRSATGFPMRAWLDELEPPLATACLRRVARERAVLAPIAQLSAALASDLAADL